MEKLTDKNYQVPSSEKHLVHVRLMVKENDTSKKEYVKKYSIQKFQKDHFKRLVKTNFLSSYDEVAVLYNPDTAKEENPFVERYIAIFNKKPTAKMKPEEIQEKVEFHELSEVYKSKTGQESIPEGITTSQQLKELFEEI